MSNSRSVPRNDLDNFSTNSGGTISLDHGNGLNDDSQISLASTASAPISTNAEDGHNHNNNHHTNNVGPNSKYEKLVQDYVKLRSKLSILKKAYVELSESSAQKDQSLRKCEQEIEGLSFRNQQLTSRVEVLQRDLAEATNNLSLAAMTGTSISTTTSGNAVSSSSMKLSPSNSSLVSPNNQTIHHSSSLAATPSNIPSSTSSSSSNLLLMPNHPSNHSFNHQSGALINSPDNKVIAEELEHKINENTVLHRRLNEVEMEFRQKLAKTEQSLKQIEYEKCLLEKKLESLEVSSKQTIERLQNDKIKLELNLIQLESQLRETHQEKESLLLERTTSNEQQQKQESLNKNSSSSSLSSIPNHSASSRLNEDSSSIMNCVRSSVEALSRTYANLEERNTLLKPFLANGPLKLASKCEQTLVSIEQKFTSGKIEPAQIVAQFDEFIELNKKLIQATVAELGVSTSVSLAQSTQSAVLAKPSEEMDKLHKKLKIYLNKIDVFLFDASNTNNQNPDESPCFSHYLTRLLGYILSPVPLQQPSPPRVSTSNQVTSSMLRTKIAPGLKQLADLIDKLLFAYNEKLSLEYTLDYSSSVTTLDECLVSYFGQLKQSLSQLASLVSETSSNPLEILDVIRSELVVLFPPPTLLVVVDGPAYDPPTQSPVKDNTEEMEALREELGKRESEFKDLSDSYEQLKESYEASVRLGDELKSRLEKLQSQYLDLDERHRRIKSSDDESKSVVSSNDDDRVQSTAVSNLEAELTIKYAEQQNLIITTKLKKEKDPVSEPTPSENPSSKNQPEKEKEVVNKTTEDSQEDVLQTLEFMVENVDLIDTYQKQIDTLNSRIEYLDSKTVYYHDEVRSLVERLRLQHESNRLAGLELDEVKDQLDRTRSSYETQMSTMSDHLIEMTDRMSRHVEENDKLRLELAHARSNPSTASATPANNKSSSKSSSAAKKSK